MQRLPTRFLALAGFLVILLIATYQSRENLIAGTLASVLGSEVGIRQVHSIYLSGIVAEGVTISNDNYLFSAKEVELAIDLSAFLFSDQIIIEQAKLSESDLVLTPQPRTDESESGTRIPLIALQAFHLNSVRVDYEDADQDFVVLIERCSSQTLNESVQWDCNGSIDEEPIEIKGQYGLPDDDGQTEPFNLDLDWQDVELNVVGEMDHPASLEDAKLNVKLNAESSKPLLELLGIPEVRESSIALVADYWDTEVGFIISMVGRMGEMQFSAGGGADGFSAMQKANLKYDLSGPSLYEAGALFDYLRFEDVPFAIKGDLSRDPDFGLKAENIRLSLQDGKVAGSLAMPSFPATEDMSLELSGDEMSPTLLQPLVGTCELPKEKLAWRGRINIDANGTEVVDVSVSGKRHRLNVNGTLNSNNVSGAIDLAVESSGFSFQEIGQCFELVLPDITTELDTNFSWQEGQLTFNDITLDSSIFAAKGNVSVVPGTDVPFVIDLEISTPDARKLTESLFADAGPLNDFPLAGHIKLTGDRNLIPEFSFRFTAGDHEGFINGALGVPETLDGLNLSLTMDGDNLGALLTDPEKRTPSGQAFSMRTNVSRSNNVWYMTALSMSVADAEISGSGSTSGTNLLDTNIELTGSGENLEHLLGPWIDIPVPNIPFTIDIAAENLTQGLHIKKFVLQMGEHKVTSQMMIDNPPDYSESNGTFEMSGPSTRELFDTLGIKQPILDRPYEMSFNVEGEAEFLLINNISASIGESDLKGSLRFADTTPPTLHAMLESDSLYIPLFSPDMLDEEATSSSPKATEVFPSSPLPFEALNRFNGDIQYKVERIWRNPDYSTGIAFDLSLQDGALTTDYFVWEGPDARGELSAKLSPLKDAYKVSVSANSDRIPLIWLLAGDAEPSTDTQFHLDLESSGLSTKDLMANMNGTILFKGGAGVFKGRALDLYFGDFLQSIAANITNNRESTTRIACTAGAINIVDGKANVSPGLLARTDRVDVFATGTINLSREKPDITVLTKSRTGIGLSAAKVVAPRLKVKGTLASPKFSIDSTGAAVNTWLALSSGGLSLLASGLWDRMSSGADACGDMYREARKLPEYNHYRQQSASKSDS